MKKILFILALSTSLFSCNDWLDVNTDPNYPATVDPFLSIPAIEGSMAAQIGGIMHNYTGIFAQYIDQLPECMQYNDIVTYNLTTSSDLMDRNYAGLYAGALEDANVILKSDVATNADKFVATVLRANIFQVVVDQLDQAPYSEALQGAALPMPKWDNGADIYKGILDEIDAALLTVNAALPLSGDLIFNNNMGQWIGYAKALKLRILIRSSYAQDNSAKIKALIDEGGFFTGDAKFAAFADESNKRNPWYETNFKALNTQNLTASLPLTSYLLATNDPRITTLFAKTAAGNYSGIVPGARVGNTELKKVDFSQPAISPVQPVYFFLQSELQFFLAEAYLRFYNDDAKAKAAYEAGVAANFATRGVAIGDYTPAAWAGSTDAKLELIGMQKWVGSAMLNNAESWSEVRRLGIPKLSPSDGAAVDKDPTVYTAGQLISPMSSTLGSGKLIKRVLFPESAVKYNKNTPHQEQSNLNDKVWWDKK
jgi:hypothetical protein